MPTVRIILLNYKRPENTRKIVNAFNFIYPITVINNNPDEHLSTLNADVINNDVNKKCMERWVQCFKYPEEFKVILDDDILPHKKLIDKMLLMNEPMVGIYGKSGVNKADSYIELNDHWCVNATVDFLVGSVIMVKQNVLNIIRCLGFVFAMFAPEDTSTFAFCLLHRLPFLAVSGSAYRSCSKLANLFEQVSHSLWDPLT